MYCKNGKHFGARLEDLGEAAAKIADVGLSYIPLQTKYGAKSNIVRGIVEWFLSIAGFYGNPDWPTRRIAYQIKKACFPIFAKKFVKFVHIKKYKVLRGLYKKITGSNNEDSFLKDLSEVANCYSGNISEREFTIPEAFMTLIKSQIPIKYQRFSDPFNFLVIPYFSKNPADYKFGALSETDDEWVDTNFACLGRGNPEIDKCIRKAVRGAVYRDSTSVLVLPLHEAKSSRWFFHSSVHKICTWKEGDFMLNNKPLDYTLILFMVRKTVLDGILNFTSKLQACSQKIFGTPLSPSCTIPSDSPDNESPFYENIPQPPTLPMGFGYLTYTMKIVGTDEKDLVSFEHIEMA